jgi:hypothetical protein
MGNDGQYVNSTGNKLIFLSVLPSQRYPITFWKNQTKYYAHCFTPTSKQESNPQVLQSLLISYSSYTQGFLKYRIWISLTINPMISDKCRQWPYHHCTFYLTFTYVESTCHTAQWSEFNTHRFSEWIAWGKKKKEA